MKKNRKGKRATSRSGEIEVLEAQLWAYTSVGHRTYLKTRRNHRFGKNIGEEEIKSVVGRFSQLAWSEIWVETAAWIL